MDVADRTPGESQSCRGQQPHDILHSKREAISHVALQSLNMLRIMIVAYICALWLVGAEWELDSLHGISPFNCKLYATIAVISSFPVQSVN
jgi:hypothetical protein